MIRCELVCWPVILSLAEGEQTLADQQAFLADWNSWLDRDEAFAVLRLFTLPAALVHPEGGARLAKEWMRDNQARIRRSVLGLASVVPESAYARMSRMNMAKAFGVPAAIFRAQGPALDWLETEAFGRQGRVFPRAAVQAALARSAAGRL
jgi:hypothetical protein